MADLERQPSQRTAGTAVDSPPATTALEAAHKSDADVEKRSKAQQESEAVADAEATRPHSNETLNDPYTPPDGGWKAWATVIASWLILFSSFGYVNAFGVYQEYYLANYLTHKSASDIAWIGSFQLFLQFAMGTVTGKLFDEGYYRYLTIGGSIIYVVGLFMVSLATEYYSIFLAQGLTLGIGVGLLFMPAVGAISHHFRRRRALAVGIAVSGSSIGGIVFPIMLNNLFQSVGFASGVRATAYLILGCLVIANCLISTRLPPRKKRPAHMQVAPDMKGILTDVPYVINAFGLLFIMLGLFFPIFYIQLFAISKRIDSNVTLYCLAILNAGSVFGRVLPNFLADRFGAFNLILPCILLSGALQWIMLACGSTGGIIVFALLYGFFSGAYVSLLPSVSIAFARSLAEVGVRMGLPFLLISIAALVGAPICGQLIGSGPNFEWWKGSTFSGAVIFFGSALMFLSRTQLARRKGTQIV